MTHDDRLLRTLMAALSHSATLKVILENQETLFEHLGIKPDSGTSVREDFDTRWAGHYVELLRDSFGVDGNGLPSLPTLESDPPPPGGQ
jgi:hypothetical protein